MDDLQKLLDTATAEGRLDEVLRRVNELQAAGKVGQKRPATSPAGSPGHERSKAPKTSPTVDECLQELNDLIASHPDSIERYVAFQSWFYRLLEDCDDPEIIIAEPRRSPKAKGPSEHRI
jgi:hypothetical protein